MSVDTKYFNEEIWAKVIWAYLNDSKSHRRIQKEILKKDAPARGGGFLAMDILHSYEIDGTKKGILKNNSFVEEYSKANGKYKEALDLLKRYSYIGGNTIENIRENPDPLVTNKDLINHIYSYIRSKGFYYTKEEVINLFLSIKTKPFVILSGISGTGKTKIVQWFAESVGATEENGRFTLIPVRPDWNDSSDLLGYVDIKGDFKPGPLTKVIEKAEKNSNLPYFVLLDEMNLARVEHYFSDILSVMESRNWQNGELVTSALLTMETANHDIKLPPNLYIIGTVNMDETTHPFSKKVLDRANTIEFNRVDLTNLSFLEEKKVVEPIAVSDGKFRASYLHLKDLYSSNKKLVDNATAELEKMNESLQLINAHVGYRVRDEICFYLDYNENSDLLEQKVAFDHCILQKILPRISGSDKRVEQLLTELYRLFTGRGYIENQDGFEEELKHAKYPKSAAKVLEMLRRLRDDGFTSFWIS
ncbi:AAA family ATPase [Neobacillus novalis]|uniref:AAA family ATPase n=1 Tax=Neobacillus novalis TaxID=220687 RepID=A0AA95MTI4_9BACI|nr:AAA family ATPase [Neobacillus novalis]WHY87066.1 AAA family ATPase [Neobacillus novalis]